MLTLNQDYETDITIPVHVKDVPEDIGFSASGEEIIEIRVRDRGTMLMDYMFTSFLPISIDYTEFENRRGRLSLPVSALKKRVEGQLLSSTTLVAMQPDSFVYYTRESAIRIPVKLNGKYTVAKQYASSAPKLIPDSVWLYAPESVADTLLAIYTMPFEEYELRDSLKTDLPLSIPQGIKCVPSDVKVIIPVSPFAEKSFELPVLGVGFPDSCRLRTFPSRAKVVMNVNMALYDDISENDFELGIKYDDIADGVHSRAQIYLLRAPEDVRDVRIVPDEVEYLIEMQ